MGTFFSHRNLKSVHACTILPLTIHINRGFADPRGFQLRSVSIRRVSAVNFRCSLGPVPVPPLTSLSAVASARAACPAIKNNDDLYARCATRKMKQMIRKVLISTGILMLMSASVATQDLAVMTATVLTLGSSVAAYKHAILDGFGRDGEGCVPMSLDCFEVREVPGKGMGLFTTSHIPKDRFLMRYEGERINDLEFELRYADNPFSDKVMITHQSYCYHSSHWHALPPSPPPFSLQPSCPSTPPRQSHNVTLVMVLYM